MPKAENYFKRSQIIPATCRGTGPFDTHSREARGRDAVTYKIVLWTYYDHPFPANRLLYQVGPLNFQQVWDRSHTCPCLGTIARICVDCSALVSLESVHVSSTVCISVKYSLPDHSVDSGQMCRTRPTLGGFAPSLSNKRPRTRQMATASAADWVKEVQAAPICLLTRHGPVPRPLDAPLAFFL